MDTSRTTEAEKPTPNIQEERAHFLNILASRFAATSDVEKNLSRENTEPAKYTPLNGETDLKQPRNDTETDVKYFNFKPDQRPACCPVPQVRGRFPASPENKRTRKQAGDAGVPLNINNFLVGDQRAASGRARAEAGDAGDFPIPPSVRAATSFMPRTIRCVSAVNPVSSIDHAAYLCLTMEASNVQATHKLVAGAVLPQRLPLGFQPALPRSWRSLVAFLSRLRVAF